MENRKIGTLLSRYLKSLFNKQNQVTQLGQKCFGVAQWSMFMYQCPVSSRTVAPGYYRLDISSITPCLVVTTKTMSPENAKWFLRWVVEVGRVDQIDLEGKIWCLSLVWGIFFSLPSTFPSFLPQTFVLRSLTYSLVPQKYCFCSPSSLMELIFFLLITCDPCLSAQRSIVYMIKFCHQIIGSE